MPQEVACGIVAQACSGLHYAHEKTMPDGSPLNIIHRDVSPQNLILTYEGLVKVLDFGIAKADHRQSQTRTGLVKGKFSYMSPEQCLGQALDRRSDVFALGIVLFELCTARRLFKRALDVRHLHGDHQGRRAVAAASSTRRWTRRWRR